MIQALDSGVFAVSRDTPTGSDSLGRLNFDQVVALLENYFVFNDDSDFVFYDNLWKVIDDFEEKHGVKRGKLWVIKDEV